MQKWKQKQDGQTGRRKKRGWECGGEVAAVARAGGQAGSRSPCRCREGGQHLGADLVVADLGRLVVELRLGAGSGAGASSAAGCSPAGAASTAARLAAADTAGQSLQLAQMRGAWVR